MKKITLLVVGLLCFANSLSAQAPEWEWAKMATGDHSVHFRSVAVDGNGNVYVAGDHQSTTADFGSQAITNVTANNEARDGFLAKYDEEGSLLWIKSYNTTGHEDISSVVTDSENNVYVAGAFQGPTLDVEGTILTGVGENDLFVVKYNADGDVLWARNAGGNLYDYALCMAVDNAGNVFVGGNFYSASVTFDEGITVTNANNGDMHDVYLVKYNSAGEAMWARSGSGLNYDEATELTTDAAGNVFLAGYFYSPTIVFGETALQNTNQYGDIFLVKYDTNGNIIWAKKEGGDNYDTPRGLQVAADGSIFMTGHFESSTFTLGETTLTNSGSYDIYITKMDSNGNPVWAKGVGGSGLDGSNALVINSANEAIISGTTGTPTLTFPGVPALTINGDYDMFIAKFDNDGDVMWAKNTGGDGYENSKALGVSAAGDVYVTGSMRSDSATFGETVLTITEGITGEYLAKMPSALLGTGDFSLTAATLYPNPAKDILNITGYEASEYQVIDISGRIISNGILDNGQVNVSALPSGMYFLNINNTTIKFIKE